MSSTYGKHLHLSIFGQSHGPAIGMTLDGIPAGLPVDFDALQTFLNRRAPGKDLYATSRFEHDVPEFLSGIVNGFTCGAPIAAIIHNQDQNTNDYTALSDTPRPGHADFTAHEKYKGFEDLAGGGHFSGRLTAALCIAGGLCKQWLAENGIRIGAHILSIGDITDGPVHLNWVSPDLDQICSDFPVINHEAGACMKKAIAAAKDSGDSLGGIIECIVTGLPTGLGDPMFDGMESKLAQIIYGIPAVKGLEFGSGFQGSFMLGSENNDSFIIENGSVKTTTNNCGGIHGGITNGMPLIFRAAIKPTPSICVPQETISYTRQAATTIKITGRHDPCIVPRAVPVIEAAAAIAVFDAILCK